MTAKFLLTIICGALISYTLAAALWYGVPAVRSWRRRRRTRRSRDRLRLIAAREFDGVLTPEGLERYIEQRVPQH